MARARLLILTLSLPMLLLSPASSHSATLPTDDEVSGVLKACGGGRYQAIEGDVKAKISIWKKNAEVSGKISKDDLSGILSQVPNNQQISPENYKTYTECILNLMDKYLKAEIPCPNGAGIVLQNTTNSYTRYNDVTGPGCGILDKGGSGNTHEHNTITVPTPPPTPSAPPPRSQ
jgi:hypothetical protein